LIYHVTRILIIALCLGLSKPMAIAQEHAVSFFSSTNVAMNRILPVAVWGDVLQTGTMEIKGQSNVYFYGKTWNSDSLKLVQAKIYFAGRDKQYLTGDSLQIASMVIYNPTGVTLKGNLLLKEGLSLDSGHLILKGAQLVLDSNAAITSYSHQRNIIIDSLNQLYGSVTKKGLDSTDGWVDVPIASGINAYTPLRIKNRGVQDDFTFYVTNAVLQDGNSGSKVNFDHCGTSWFIEEQNQGGSLVSIQLQHNHAVPDFNLSRRFVSRFTGVAPNFGGDSSSNIKWDMMKKTSTIDSLMYGDITTDAALTNAVITRRDSITSFSPFTVRSYPVAPLPVQWLNFDGEWYDNDVRLSWITANELNNNGFEVQRSYDGVGFKPIDFVPSKSASGNSMVTLNYLYNDQTVLHSATAVYYRLKQVDLDGHAEFSSVVKLSREAIRKTAYSIYPNPSEGVISVQVDDEDVAFYMLQVHNALGQKVYNSKPLSNLSANTLYLRLVPGVYFVHALDLAKQILFIQPIVIE